jgi:large subunit ribosomal protein L34
MKRTYQPKKGRRKSRHGFLKRMSTAKGADVIKKRRRIGRKKLSV